MPKRRNVLMGLGAIAVGSGALSAASLTDSATPDADFRVIAAQELAVRRGDDEEFDEEEDFGDLGTTDLPYAFVNDQENDDLAIEVAIQNASGGPGEQEFRELLEVEYTGTGEEGGAVDIGIDFVSYGEDINEEAWDESEELDRKDVQEIFQFHLNEDSINAGDLEDASPPTPISPDPDTDSDEYGATFEMEAGDTVYLDLVTNIRSGDQVSLINDAADIGGNPWGDEATDGVDFLDEIEIGIVD